MMTVKSKITFALFHDFRFWIFLFFLVRLIGISYPPIEPSHNWRQAVTLSTTRHFVEDGPQLLFPETDIAGADHWNVIAGEFPFFNYLIYLFSLVFGYDHWYGRLINLVISSWGIYAFYRFLKDRLNPTHALYAGLLLLTSVWFMFSRKIMPDTFSCSLVLIGIRQADLFLRDKKMLYLVSFFLTASLGLLVKLPAAMLMLFLWPLVTAPSSALKNRIALGTIAFLSVTPALIWYYYWVPLLLTNGAFQLYFPYSLSEGWRQLKSSIHFLPGRFYFTAFCSYAATVLWVSGFIYTVKNKHKWGIVFIAAFVLLIYFILKTGSVFALHDYYIIPFVPFMAWWAGYAIEQLKDKRWIFILAIVAMTEGIFNQQHDLRWNHSGEYKLRLESAVNKYLKEGEPLAVLSEGNPSDMYFAHRSGWNVKMEELTNEVLINRMMSNGCRYLLVIKTNPYSTYFLQQFSVSEDEQGFTLVALESLRRRT